MPSEPLKNTVKKTVKKTLPAAPALAAPGLSPSHHGLAAITIILIFLAIGCLAAAMLMSQKIKTLSYYGQTVAASLAASQKKNAELSDDIMNIRTLQELAKMAAAPKTVPADIVWATYASPNISLQYPSDYTVVKATAAFPALTIKSPKGRIEIFRMKDFPGGDRPWGFEEEITREDFDNYVPHEFKTAAPDPANPKILPYNVWIYYNEGDEATKAVLDQTAASIKVVK